MRRHRRIPPGPGRSLRPVRTLLALSLPLLAACSTQATLRAGGRSWLWVLAPIALFAVVQGPGMVLDRHRDSRRSGPTGARSYLAGLALVVVATLVFVACNLAVDMPPEGKLANLAAWFAGALAGAVGGVLVERRSAVAAKNAPAVRPTRRRSR